MRAVGFAVFETAIGNCGAAWSEAGIVGVQLPERSAAATRARMARRFPDAAEGVPPPSVAFTLGEVVRLLQGERIDLSATPLDQDGIDDFERRVYAVARSIPAGSTLTYGEIAARMGLPGAARAVGRALGRNPFPIIVPCHRVLAAAGAAGGFSASGGVMTKARMLSIEGARTSAAPLLFDRLAISVKPPR